MQLDTNYTKSQQKFGAKITVKSNEMKNYVKYLQQNKNAENGCYDSKKDLDLTNRIFDAFEKHPSKEEITTDVAYFKGLLFNARGVIKSSKAVFIDTEPARSDSIAPIQNIFRRILDPQNKKTFNRLVGEEHAPVYEAWWENNIAPIWKDIKQNFREKTFFDGNHDKEFNADFNRESGNIGDLFNQKGNFWITLYNKHI